MMARLDRFDTDEVAAGLIAYLDDSPTPFHAVASAAALLEGAGFTEVDETQAFPEGPGRHYLVRGGSLVAWSTEHLPAGAGPATGFRVVGAHTDSPTLRIKPRPDVSSAGFAQLAVEPYGGLITNSWLDRDLGLAGRVTLRDPQGTDGVRTELLDVDEALLRVSRLAIHLDRDVREGEALNAQRHLVPHWSVSPDAPAFTTWLAGRLGVAEADVLGWDLMAYDLTGAARIGLDGGLIASARLDNLATSYAAVRALLDAVGSPVGDGAAIPLIALFDHEEVGSMTERGAFSQLLPAVLERIVLARGGDRQDHLRALASTVIASGDMAHATHPNYADRHEPGHHIAVNGGPVLKVNTNGRYATDGLGTAAFRLACQQAGVPMQEFVVRSDLPCGSTVGPMTAALTGSTTVDFGAPTLSMHSIREVCGTADQAMYAACLAAFLDPA
ncbi:M18 family aminopeptidase [Kytococcus schroeteri]|uniref:M18 family aminopeptidase n=1 Tax=Kytococcus schroeteri TaxID=138300 RepID=A0A2I1PDL7_9MICO|nr:M18 family aminopeptidase [Kytococcus schroeteri]PKZ42719.1 M18 family aminopeptidase [Kytococcus schroeteri]